MSLVLDREVSALECPPRDSGIPDLRSRTQCVPHWTLSRLRRGTRLGSEGSVWGWNPRGESETHPKPPSLSSEHHYRRSTVFLLQWRLQINDHYYFPDSLCPSLISKTHFVSKPESGNYCNRPRSLSPRFLCWWMRKNFLTPKPLS